MSEVQEKSPQVRITISEVLSLLDQGKNRKEIAEHFGQTQTAMQKMVWSNPKLKAKKAKKQYSNEIILEDDTAEEVQAVNADDLVEVVVADAEAVKTTEEAEVSPVDDNASQW